MSRFYFISYLIGLRIEKDEEEWITLFRFALFILGVWWMMVAKDIYRVVLSTYNVAEDYH